MAGKAFFSVTVSLDGFIAPEERMDFSEERMFDLREQAWPQAPVDAGRAAPARRA